MNLDSKKEQKVHIALVCHCDNVTEVDCQVVLFRDQVEFQSLMQSLLARTGFLRSSSQLKFETVSAYRVSILRHTMDFLGAEPPVNDPPSRMEGAMMVANPLTKIEIDY